MASLIEYLYIDHQRLNSYFDQIKKAAKYDKIPSWKVEVGFPAGAKVEGGQNGIVRPWTDDEKLKAVINYFQTKQYIEYKRQYAKIDSAIEFKFEICSARKVFIPPDQSKPTDFKGLNIWISPGLEQGGGMLFLIENYHCDDSFIITMPSGYSSLLTLLSIYYSDLKTDLKEMVIGDFINKGLADTQEQVLSEFAVNPIRFLSVLGARISDIRQIQSLYRIRATLLDCCPSPETQSEPANTLWTAQSGTATIAYPIFVAEANPPLLDNIPPRE